MEKKVNVFWIELNDNLKKYISTRVQNNYDVEDILQEVLLKIHTNIGELKDIAKIYPWIYKITKNTIIDYYRNQKKTDKLSDSFEEVKMDMDEAETINQLTACLKPMIDDLPDIYKEAITLTELGGLTQRELADKLGISVSGAKSRVQRGRALLKEMLLACCQFQFDTCGNIIDYRHKENNCKYC